MLGHGQAHFADANEMGFHSLPIQVP
jgi:hypothetical protein